MVDKTNSRVDSKNSPGIEPILNEYENLKTELQSIYEKKETSAIFRSKCHWVKEGECPTFLSLNVMEKMEQRLKIRKILDCEYTRNYLLYQSIKALSSSAWTPNAS